MEPLLHGHYYHIYNRGINSESLFISRDNYVHFLRLFDKYVQPITETFAWCLMPNHFHFLVRIKEVEEINKTVNPVRALNQTVNPVRVLNPDRVESDVKIKPPHLYFSHLFNSYTQAFNKYSSRHGNLFERPFKRKPIEHENYLKQLILYIHNNPVKHEFTDSPGNYPWSSYNEIISDKPTKLLRDKILGLFENRENFIVCHSKTYNPIDDTDLIIE